MNEHFPWKSSLDFSIFSAILKKNIFTIFLKHIFLIFDFGLKKKIIKIFP